MGSPNNGDSDDEKRKGKIGESAAILIQNTAIVLIFLLSKVDNTTKFFEVTSVQPHAEN